IYMKRDDLLGLAGGGNKTRKLEFLVADALKQGADTLITCGAVQSNHCRLTLAAARKENLSCHLVLEERVKDSYYTKASGNNFLLNLLGAEGISVVPGGTDMMKEMHEIAKKLQTQGQKTYIIPGGGSNEIGATGYVNCAQELLRQFFDKSIIFNHIITPSGSAGTHAGMVVGMKASNNNIPITGISVNKDKETQINNVYNLIQKTADYLNVDNEINKNAVNVFDDYIGKGYSLPTDEMVEAIELLAQHEGILMDPIYT